MKNSLKKTYYKFVKKGQLKSYNIKLGYILHTEKIYDPQLFEQLLKFCNIYFEITGVKPICAIIPPTNALLNREMAESKFSEEDFIAQVTELSKYATIGYHGHFYLNNDAKYYNAIHCNSYRKADLAEQFNTDVRWFKKNKISHNNIYSAGWWFMNEDLISLLIAHGFQYDFSVSKARFFYNQFSNLVMNQHKIKTGEPFDICLANNKKLKFIQNFIGMHTTNFPEDFDRNMKKILDENHNVIGVVNSHDYDLDFTNTLNCIKYQIDTNDVKFCSFEQLAGTNSQKTIKLPAQISLV